jgi:capsular exopolysaccharide synthesis family protein
VAAVFLAAAVYTFRAIPVYRGTTRILIEQALPRLLDSQDSYYQFGDPYDFYQTQYRLLESRRIAERVMRRLKLFEDPELSAAADPVAAFGSHAKIQPVRNSRLVDISIDHTVPARAAQWADTFAEEYIADTLERRQKAEKETLSEMTKEVEPLRARLDKQEKDVQAFREKRSLVSINEKQSLLERRLEELSSLALGAEKERRDLEATQERLATILKDNDVNALFTLPRIQANPLCQKIQEQQVQLLQEREDLSKTYKDKHPKLLAVESKLVSLATSLRREAERVVEGTRSSYEEAKGRERKAKEALEAAKGEKVLFDRDLIELSQLQREAEATRTLYQNLLKRTQETRVTASVELTNINIVDRAKEPTEPIAPNRALNLLLGLLGGLAAGVAAAFLVEQIDNTIDSPEKAERSLGVPVLGLIPRVILNGEAKEKQETAGELGTPPELICFWDGKSQVSEAFRSIRTAIQFSGVSGRTVRTLAVVSATPEEGKTLAVLNLAVTMAQAGHRVLLVDSDLRRPRLHKILCPNRMPHRGLSNILIGEVTLDAVARETPVPGLWCVPAGPVPPNPSELLGSPRMAEFLREAAAKFDRILFDSPPVGAVTDACVVAPLLDGVVQVISYAQTTSQDAREGKQKLISLGARYLGAILNNVPLSRWRIGRYGFVRYFQQEGERPKP